MIWFYYPFTPSFHWLVFIKFLLKRENHTWTKQMKNWQVKVFLPLLHLHNIVFLNICIPIYHFKTDFKPSPTMDLALSNSMTFCHQVLSLCFNFSSLICFLIKFLLLLCLFHLSLFSQHSSIRLLNKNVPSVSQYFIFYCDYYEKINYKIHLHRHRFSKSKELQKCAFLKYHRRFW